ncbi:MAG: hypothetical protein ACR2HM_01630 [Acidimicrobiales bacterium]
MAESSPELRERLSAMFAALRDVVAGRLGDTARHRGIEVDASQLGDQFLAVLEGSIVLSKAHADPTAPPPGAGVAEPGPRPAPRVGARRRAGVRTFDRRCRRRSRLSATVWVHSDEPAMAWTCSQRSSAQENPQGAPSSPDASRTRPQRRDVYRPAASAVRPSGLSAPVQAP